MIEVHAVQSVAKSLLGRCVQHFRLRLARVGHPRDEKDLTQLAPVAVLNLPVQHHVTGLVGGEGSRKLLKVERRALSTRRDVTFVRVVVGEEGESGQQQHECWILQYE